MPLTVKTNQRLVPSKLQLESQTSASQAEIHLINKNKEKKVQPFHFLTHLKWLCRTLFLFTKTDIHNLVLPACTLNLVLHLYFRSECTQYHWSITCWSIIKTFVWGYLGLIHIDVGNQLMGIEEDRLNKPFRPLVTGLITKEGALQLVTFSTIVFVLVGNAMQVLWSTLGFMAATSIYNLTQTPTHWIGKNFCNAWGYGCFFSAGAWIAYLDLLQMQGLEAPIRQLIHQVLPFHMINIFVTITIQDLRDIGGDLKVNRLTQNLDWGELKTRVYLCGSMAFMTCLSQWLFPLSSSLGSFPSWMFSFNDFVGKRNVYYMTLWGLQTWMGYRILRDCPTYDIVTLPNGKRIPVYQFEASVELNDSAKESPKLMDKEVIEQMKREQYEKDDVSFKIYILWLYLFTFNILF